MQVCRGCMQAPLQHLGPKSSDSNRDSCQNLHLDLQGMHACRQAGTFPAPFQHLSSTSGPKSSEFSRVSCQNLHPDLQGMHACMQAGTFPAPGRHLSSTFPAPFQHLGPKITNSRGDSCQNLPFLGTQVVRGMHAGRQAGTSPESGRHLPSTSPAPRAQNHRF